MDLSINTDFRRLHYSAKHHHGKYLSAHQSTAPRILKSPAVRQRVTREIKLRNLSLKDLLELNDLLFSSTALQDSAATHEPGPLGQLKIEIQEYLLRNPPSCDLSINNNERLEPAEAVRLAMAITPGTQRIEPTNTNKTPWMDFPVPVWGGATYRDFQKLDPEKQTESIEALKSAYEILQEHRRTSINQPTDRDRQSFPLESIFQSLLTLINASSNDGIEKQRQRFEVMLEAQLQKFSNITLPLDGSFLLKTLFATFPSDELDLTQQDASERVDPKINPLILLRAYYNPSGNSVASLQNAELDSSEQEAFRELKEEINSFRSLEACSHFYNNLLDILQDESQISYTQASELIHLINEKSKSYGRELPDYFFGSVNAVKYQFFQDLMDALYKTNSAEEKKKAFLSLVNKIRGSFMSGSISFKDAQVMFTELGIYISKEYVKDQTSLLNGETLSESSDLTQLLGYLSKQLSALINPYSVELAGRTCGDLRPNLSKDVQVSATNFLSFVRILGDERIEDDCVHDRISLDSMKKHIDIALSSLDSVIEKVNTSIGRSSNQNLVNIQKLAAKHKALLLKIKTEYRRYLSGSITLGQFRTFVGEINRHLNLYPFYDPLQSLPKAQSVEKAMDEKYLNPVNPKTAILYVDIIGSTVKLFKDLEKGPKMIVHSIQNALDNLQTILKSLGIQITSQNNGDGGEVSIINAGDSMASPALNGGWMISGFRNAMQIALPYIEEFRNILQKAGLEARVNLIDVAAINRLADIHNSEPGNQPVTYEFWHCLYQLKGSNTVIHTLAGNGLDVMERIFKSKYPGIDPAKFEITKILNAQERESTKQLKVLRKLIEEYSEEQRIYLDYLSRFQEEMHPNNRTEVDQVDDEQIPKKSNEISNLRGGIISNPNSKQTLLKIVQAKESFFFPNLLLSFQSAQNTVPYSQVWEICTQSLPRLNERIKENENSISLFLQSDTIKPGSFNWPLSKNEIHDLLQRLQEYAISEEGLRAGFRFACFPTPAIALFGSEQFSPEKITTQYTGHLDRLPSWLSANGVVKISGNSLLEDNGQESGLTRQEAIGLFCASIIPKLQIAFQNLAQACPINGDLLLRSWLNSELNSENPGVEFIQKYIWSLIQSYSDENSQNPKLRISNSQTSETLYLPFEPPSNMILAISRLGFTCENLQTSIKQASPQLLISEIGQEAPPTQFEGLSALINSLNLIIRQRKTGPEKKNQAKSLVLILNGSFIRSGLKNSQTISLNEMKSNFQTRIDELRSRIAELDLVITPDQYKEESQELKQQLVRLSLMLIDNTVENLDEEIVSNIKELSKYAIALSFYLTKKGKN
jgi:hypothetical protein